MSSSSSSSSAESLIVRDRVGHLLGDVTVGVGGVRSARDEGRPSPCRPPRPPRAAARRRGESRTRGIDGRGYRPTPASVAEGGAGEGRESEVSAAYRGIPSNGPRARVGADAKRGREANGGSGGRAPVGGGGGTRGRLGRVDWRAAGSCDAPGTLPCRRGFSPFGLPDSWRKRDRCATDASCGGPRRFRLIHTLRFTMS